MPDALVGFTGFVGGNLLRQRRFDDLYNSRNIESIAGKEYELLVCAGAPAEKWKANRDPETDHANIQRLLTSLQQVRARHVVVVSTVDVYPAPVGVDEDTLIDRNACHAYGKHRLMLEEALAHQFQTTIVRLPGLFGKGLKKNIIFDPLHDNLVQQVHCESVFQFYDLEHLWTDVETARRGGVSLVNFATEPTSVGEVAAAGFGRVFANRPESPPARYDFKSRHASLFGGHSGYLYNKQQVLSGIAAFVAAERNLQ